VVWRFGGLADHSSILNGSGEEAFAEGGGLKNRNDRNFQMIETAG
jgi:hypothetical protein